MERAAGQLWNALAQAADHIIKRQERVTAKRDNDRLLGVGEHGAPWQARPHGRVGCRGAPRPLRDRLRVQPIAGGEVTGRFLRPLECGSNARRRAG